MARVQLDPRDQRDHKDQQDPRGQMEQPVLRDQQGRPVLILQLLARPAQREQAERRGQRDRLGRPAQLLPLQVRLVLRVRHQLRRVQLALPAQPEQAG